MKLEHAQMIVEAALGRGVDAEVYENYSGRGMYGRTTAGVVISDMPAFIAALGRAVREHDSGDLCEAMESVSSDSMGLDIIVY